MSRNTFKGRSLTVINDFSYDEKMYLFQKARELKQYLKEENHEKIDEFRINDPDFGIYEVFIEDSTRTKESFKNAAEFHRVKLSNLDTTHSSINKQESFADTFNTLTGYDNSIFIVRSRQEGLCRWLEENGRNYAMRNELKNPPAFINAGDGKHEHPTQELLDDFTFLEHNDWNADSIHIALAGDLFHGRTVHSKADGLKIFKKVKVDLIAPQELAMPDYYLDKMKKNGFEVNTFSSIQEYIDNGNMAKIWYFTRPQLERMGDAVLKKQDILRDKITFKKEFIDKIPEGTIFYHPLPRHKVFPSIPTFLDSTPLNGWERQSINGKIIRIILLGLIAGKIGDDFTGEVKVRQHTEDDVSFIQELPVHNNTPIKDCSEGVKPIDNGLVIDHIFRGRTEFEIREQMARIIKTLKLYGKGGEWVTSSRAEPGMMKGIIFRPNHGELGTKNMKRLASLAPGCTVNIIENKHVEKKYRLSMPQKIYNFSDIECSNTDCISNHEQGENIPSEFYKISENKFICKYCEKVHTFMEIWK
ncbi:MAG: bifunctional aspartate carbamoyltransferase catalytic subunit/aspartate carbamoyltransferase regulatory subunit [Spirochaetia bacterium]|nr:bifunctional aspartate carbamoyltransferase catalytic subunit/aspartate carbamoyltransferase regulatory subunit [Spirochaetia bacterium]